MNCEDLLRDMFCIDEEFTLTIDSLKSKFSELTNSNSNVQGKIFIFLTAVIYEYIQKQIFQYQTTKCANILKS